MKRCVGRLGASFGAMALLVSGLVSVADTHTSKGLVRLTNNRYASNLHMVVLYYWTEGSAGTCERYALLKIH